MNSTILAIESSCDETSAAIVRNGKICSNIIYTQKIHESFGGVVPELASRAHQLAIVPVVHEAFQQANISKNELNAVAFTQGPGLLGSLVVGSSFAKGMALSLNLPLIGVNHMKAHVLAHFIDDPMPKFPFICLTVSGGHTQLVLVKDYLEMEIIGQTQDDAVGEAFDKVARMLGLGYPGGPPIDKWAKSGDPTKFTFPHTSMPALDYSFSGIKTSVLYFLKDQLKLHPNFIKENLADLCASIQHVLISMLLDKLSLAIQKHNINQVAIAGGVSANFSLRERLKKLAVSNNWQVFIPKFEYCTDNAAMIAMAAHHMFKCQLISNFKLKPMPNLRIELSQNKQ